MYHVMRVLLTTMLVVGYSALGVDASHAAEEFSGSVRAALYQRLHPAGMPAMRTGGDPQLQAGDILARFYAQRAYEPAWIHQDGALPGVEILLTVLSTAGRDGLRPQDYRLAQLEARFQEVRQTPTSQTPWALHRLVDLELLCTEAFLQYGSHAMSGRLHPEQVEQAWSLERDADAIDLAALLQHALTTHTIAESLHRLLPLHPMYTGLRQALDRMYRSETAFPALQEVVQSDALCIVLREPGRPGPAALEGALGAEEAQHIAHRPPLAEPGHDKRIRRRDVEHVLEQLDPLQAPFAGGRSHLHLEAAVTAEGRRGGGVPAGKGEGHRGAAQRPLGAQVGHVRPDPPEDPPGTRVLSRGLQTGP